MFSAILFVSAVVFLAYSNGANDNFKGVATLFGSGTTDYKRALFWATLTTLCGSFFSVYLSGQLVAAFSGKGLVADALVRSTPFLISVGLGSALSVYLATTFGFPISTTHALMGGLVGAGFASGNGVHWSKLWGTFFCPLLFSPILSAVLTVSIYPFFKLLRRRSGIQQESCICIEGREEVVQVTPGGAAVLQSTGLVLTVDQIEVCRTRYVGSVAGISMDRVLNGMHYLTAGAVSFARGLNDTPKIVALLLAANPASVHWALPCVGFVIAAGGLLDARRVAETMSKRITKMNHGQGFAANLVTALLVVFASGQGLPVSTTHVSCGSLFGIGLVNGRADWSMIRKILLSWLVTLPVASILSGLIFWTLR